jgi:hypothetical protein
MRAKKYRIVLGNMSRLPLSCPRMRKQSLLLLAALVAAPLFAQDDEKKAPAPVENLYFATDEYIAIPKYTFSYGYRALSGSKATFGGSSRVFNSLATAFTTSVVNSTTPVARIYDDGTVGLDTRSDGAGRPMASDGTTNNWIYEHASQVSGGFVNFNSYTAQVLESPAIESMGNTYGLEVTVSRDLPKLGRRILWNVSGGISLNDIRQHLFRYEQAKIETRTDSYYLDGQSAGTPGTAHPAVTTVTVIGPDGTPTTITTSVNDSTTIPNKPTTSNNARPTEENAGTAPAATTTDPFVATVKNHYKIKGAYYTLRVGPTFIIPVTAKFRFSLGVGAALVYAGTTYTVDSEFTPTKDETPITRTDSGYDKKALPGYYLDANLEYWITERTGLYAGAIFQSTGSYKQNITSEDTLAEVNYSTNVDLTTQTGMRLGMNIRF